MQQQLTSPKTKIFFPNLDGLRFISFFVVFFYHSYLSFFAYLKDSDPVTHSAVGFLFKHGNLGVNFFFVLSGFLITYLLIKEKELKSTIHIGNFYVRRILRIWPLYYLCLFIGFVLFTAIKKYTGESAIDTANPWYYIFFAAIFDFMQTWPERPNAMMLSVLWSVAVEEQFYLTWPILLKIIPMRKFKFVFPAIMLFSLVFRAIYSGCDEGDPEGRLFAIRYFHTFSVIGDMALGGLFAYLCSYESRFKRFFVELPRMLIVLMYVLTFTIIFFKTQLFPCGIPVIFERLVIGAFFGMIILEQNYSKNSLFKMGRFRLISKLGVYTYGLYCLHLIGMYIAVKIVAILGMNPEDTLTAWVSLVISLLLSIVISISSYHLFEKWFLKLKDRFAVIVSK